MEPRDRIKEIRKSLGLTQAEFADRLGMKWYKIKDHELGRLKITEEFALRINKEYGVNYKWILTGEEPREKDWNEKFVFALIDAGPFVDIYDSAIASKIIQAKGSKTNKKQDASSELIESSIKVNVYFNDTEMVRLALRRAGGICEKCGKPAPFIMASTNVPFLEVHHIVPAYKGGKDKLDNILMVCPNCHRELHYGQH